MNTYVSNVVVCHDVPIEGQRSITDFVHKLQVPFDNVKSVIVKHIWMLPHKRNVNPMINNDVLEISMYRWLYHIKLTPAAYHSHEYVEEIQKRITEYNIPMTLGIASYINSEYDENESKFVDYEKSYLELKIPDLPGILRIHDHYRKIKGDTTLNPNPKTFFDSVFGSTPSSIYMSRGVDISVFDVEESAVNIYLYYDKALGSLHGSMALAEHATLIGIYQIASDVNPMANDLELYIDGHMITVPTDTDISQEYIVIQKKKVVLLTMKFGNPGPDSDIGIQPVPTWVKLAVKTKTRVVTLSSQIKSREAIKESVGLVLRCPEIEGYVWQQRHQINEGVAYFQYQDRIHDQRTWSMTDEKSFSMLAPRLDRFTFWFQVIDNSETKHTDFTRSSKYRLQGVQIRVLMAVCFERPNIDVRSHMGYLNPHLRADASVREYDAYATPEQDSFEKLVMSSGRRVF